MLRWRTLAALAAILSASLVAWAQQPARPAAPQAGAETEAPPAAPGEQQAIEQQGLVDARPPLPADDAHPEVRKDVHEIYEREFAEATTRDTRRALAKELLTLGAKNQKLDERFVLIDEARKLSIASGDATMADAAISALELTFKFDADAARLSAYRAVIDATDERSDLAVFTPLVYPRVRDALQADDFTQARRYYDIAHAAVTKARDATLITEMQLRFLQQAAILDAYDLTQKEYAQLKKDGKEAEAMLAAGRFFCFIHANWKRGLPMLAAGSDEALKTLAEAELAKPAGVDEQAEIADRWWKLSEKETGMTAARMRRRSAWCYEKIVNNLEGLQRVRAERRIAESAKEPLVEPPPAPVVLDVTTAADLEKLAASKPTGAEGLKLYDVFLADVRIDAAEKQLARKQLPEWQKRAAEKLARLGTKWMPAEKAKAARQRAAENYSQAIDLLKESKDVAAHKKLVEASSLNPEDPQPQFMMGIVYAIVARNATQARQHFAACVRCDKDHHAALNNLAVAEVRLGMHVDAAKHLIDALTLNPSAEAMQNSRRLIELPIRFPAAKSPTLDELNATFVKIEGAGMRRPSFSGSKWIYMLEDNKALADYGLDARVSPKALQDDTCPMCNGQGKLPCAGSGCVRGTVIVQKTVVIGVNPATGGAITESQPARIECRECNGSGTRTCPLCGGSRRF